MKLDSNTAWSLKGYDATKAKIIAQRAGYLLLDVEPIDETSHREINSLVFVCFGDASAASEAAERLHEGLASVFGDADVALADPDLGLGDFNVETWGDESKLPPCVITQLAFDRARNDFPMASRGVSPVDLSDETMVWLNSTPPEWAATSIRDTNPRFFWLMQGDKDLGAIDCNGMKWETALVAVVRDGILGAKMDDGEARRVAATLDVLRMTRSYAPSGDETVAKKRARGTALVAARTRERYVGLLEALRVTTEDYPLPVLDKDAKKLVKTMSAEYHARKKAGTLPPKPATMRQIYKAEQIVEELGVELGFDLSKANRSQVSDFIAEHSTKLKPKR